MTFIFHVTLKANQSLQFIEMIVRFVSEILSGLKLASKFLYSYFQVFDMKN